MEKRQQGKRKGLRKRKGSGGSGGEMNNVQGREAAGYNEQLSVISDN